MDYLQQNDTPELRQLLLEKFADDLAPEADVLPAEVSEKMLDQIRKAALHRPARVAPVFSRRNVAAACLLVAVASGFFLLRTKERNTTPATARVVRRDVAAPRTNRATIILGNGQQVWLDSSNQGTLATQNGVSIEKSGDGTIAYHGNSLQNVYNTLINPRGSKPVDLTLSDGTRVWLNSESSLYYPASFAGINREVEVTGEAYFEVKKVPGSAFRVKVAGRGTVDVLGTHFNINSYTDESNTAVTLLEGNIQLTLPAAGTALKQSVHLLPGQQASYANGKNLYSTISVRKEVNLDAVMAWKNGFFNFENASLQTVMRQLARWYDIKITYEGKIASRTFGGEMQRDLNLSEVLRLLEKNNVHFTIQNNELIVKP